MLPKDRDLYVNSILTLFEPDDRVGNIRWDTHIVRAVGDLVKQAWSDGFDAGIADERRGRGDP